MANLRGTCGRNRWEEQEQVLAMLHLTDQGARDRDAAKSAASRVWELVSGLPSPECHVRLMMVLQACLRMSGTRFWMHPPRSIILRWWKQPIFATSLMDGAESKSTLKFTVLFL
jgi:hypothetical protein